jgi:SAM-dependent methyltransferase
MTQSLEKRIILNLGCGDTSMEGAINIDSIKLPNIDQVMDLEKFPYPFATNSVDEIHMYFVLEHLFDHLSVMKELHRILKPQGTLYIRVPHGSGMYGQWGEFTHFRGYGFHSFDIFKSDSKRAYYTEVRFKIVTNKVKYFLTYPYDWYKFNTWFPHWEKTWYGPFVKLYVDVIQTLIDLNPAFFERFWCYWVGGAAEVYVVLEKE